MFQNPFKIPSCLISKSELAVEQKEVQIVEYEDFSGKWTWTGSRENICGLLGPADQSVKKKNVCASCNVIQKLRELLAEKKKKN